jgi:23S rRNA (pseudouridine1915-N3)-methyltransferase
LTHLLLTVGKPKAGYIAQGLSDYLKRLKHFGGCAHELVKPERAGGGLKPSQLMAAEGQRLLSQA